jgi:hypothetical protein
MLDYMTAAQGPLNPNADADAMRNVLRQYLTDTGRIQEFSDGTADLRDHLLAIAAGYTTSGPQVELAENQAIRRDLVTTALEVHKCQERTSNTGQQYGSTECPYHANKDEISVHRGCIQLETHRFKTKKRAMQLPSQGTDPSTNHNPTNAIKVTLLGVANMGSCDTEQAGVRCRGLRTARINRKR